MSDKIIRLSDEMKGRAGQNRTQESTPVNSRLQWMADLVSAILNTETLERSSSVAKNPPKT